MSGAGAARVLPRPGDLVVTRWGARFLGRDMPCSIGRGGIGPKRGEGDGITPVGVWQLRGAMWRPDRISVPGLPGPLHAIGPRDVWSDDPRDPGYNSRRRGRDYPFSHEALRRADPLYDLIGVTDQNWPAEPGRGSAIFLHVWRSPRRTTEGCVAFRAADLAWILSRWTSQSRIVIR